ncbi:MAG: bifunctional biotin--[acetyl-CoA-carboxylase] ligase/biotin operon repressor BirA [Methylococcales bacterium]|nr:bifunctional biotin--[acetyl-CoA-carboxylase] ligase/biotin operon repressor BirA [Methylococcales bacterium]
MIFTENHAKILTCLTHDRFYSGEELSANLGLSRSAIWKYCQSFSDFGLEITALKGKGYRLNRKLELLEHDKIHQGLDQKTKALLSNLEIYPQISSTNDHLLKLMRLKNQSGHACFAEFQTKGRGRQGRQWISPFGANIYLSFSWVFDNGFASLAGLSLAIGVAVVRALNQLGIQDIGLKWPNDIYWQQQKLGGILIEISGESSGECTAIVGLGLNLYLPPEKTLNIDQPWTDLTKIRTDKTYSRNKIAALLLNHLLTISASFEEKTFHEYVSEWQTYDCMQGRKVSIYRGEQKFDGTVIGIDENGLLLLKDQHQKTIRFASGEISFRKT